MKLQRVAPAALVLASLCLAACSVDTGEGSAVSEDSPLCRGWCIRQPPLQPPPPPLPPIVFSPCGPTGPLRTKIDWLGAGFQVVHGADAVYGDPIVYYFDIEYPSGAVGTAIPGLAMDGVPAKAWVENDNVVQRNAFVGPALDASTPLTHTLTFTGPCGVSSKTITLIPHQATAPSFGYTVTSSVPGQVQLWYFEQFDGSTCQDTTQEARVNGSVVATTMNGAITLDRTSTVTITSKCTKHPSAAVRTTSFVVPVSQPQPTISSFTVSPTDGVASQSYIWANTPTAQGVTAATFTWSASIPSCSRPEVALIGRSLGTSGQLIFEKRHLPTSGSIAVSPSDEASFHLIAQCDDDGRATESGQIFVHLYNPSWFQGVSYGCFKADCTHAGCTTQAVPAAAGTDLQSAIDRIYPPSSGCTAVTIDCSEMISACGG